MKIRFAICLDVGGTSIKSAIVSSEGRLVDGSMVRTPIASRGSAEEIIQTFIRPMTEALRCSGERNLAVAGMGIGMPGPFDYDGGISLIEGVGKYESIYGVNLRDEFKRRLALSRPFPILFESDAWTFVRGEAWMGAARGYGRVIGITLGTGMGSGFMIDDEMVDKGQGVPRWGWIGGSKYKEGILDDRISRRGILQMYRELIHVPTEGLDVKEIAEKARAGERSAVRVFQETGAILGEQVRPFGEAFGVECIVIGGQIARAYDLMSDPMQRALMPIQSLKKVTPASDIDHSALFGVSRFLFKKQGLY